MSLAQLAASDPRTSAFVSAHAGTGKTTLLIDRLLRLMLAGADPARILCLTYTKAAAAEMAIRLQRRLGSWVAMPDDALARELAALEIPAGAEGLQAARALFARVLDLPGGMRIGTIHAFCQSLLRRFPLEAAISPHFQLVEPADARAELEAAREASLPRASPEALAALAGLVSADGFAGLVAELEKNRHRLAACLLLAPESLANASRRAAGALHATDAEILARATLWPGEENLRRALQTAAEQGTDSIRPKATEMLDWLSLPAELRQEHWQAWVDQFYRADGEPRAPGAFNKGKLVAKNPEIIEACLAEQARIGAVADQRRALRCAQATAALIALAAPILAAYEHTKNHRALVDYDDLIGRTRVLLKNEGAAWVLFKLDSGLDHLLLDEVQDTAPAQWDIADSLTADFFTGEGARQAANLPRTIFAVGDRKQSIYSFQGADPAEFDRWRQVYAERTAGGGAAWLARDLTISYRSTPPILALVDAVAHATGAQGGVLEGGNAVKHEPHRASHPGLVELWPLTPRPDAPAHTPWSIPERNQAQASAPQTLVAELARWIGELVAAGTPPGHILVLVRRRTDFDRALVRALKAAGVPVAGADRMVLTDQPAVQDLLALCQTLLLPQDDLSLAEWLTSPLGGLSDDSLMDLATLRTGTLWEALRGRAAERAEWRAAEAFITALMARVDYAPPYAILSEALGPLGGRARLFARLGPEAAEPVDELLAAALVHAASHPPSLQSFLHWLALSAAEIKREAEAAGDTIRVMTVHGAKGLEAPVVILPDTTGLPPDQRGLGWAKDPVTGVEIPLWQPNKDLRCQAVETLRAEAAAARLREYNRLLYVALTRARDRLLICGWQTHRGEPGNWHELATAAMQTLGAAAADFAAWPGQCLTLGSPPPPGAAADARADATLPLPAWAGSAPLWQPEALPPEPALPTKLAPSRPENADLGPVPPARSPLATPAHRDRFNRGLAMHTLLQHLPDVAPADWEDAAYAYAARPSHAIGDPDALASEALAVLRAPELAGLFGPGSRAEQPISGLIGSRIVSGQVDRLAILPDRILIADYKTNRAPPATPDKVPVLYFRQMAAYRAVLAALYPGRPIACLLIFTDGPVILELPSTLLEMHAPPA